MSLAFQTQKFWNASHFYRRSGKADRSLAIKVLEQVAADAPERFRLKDRAITVLVEIDDDEYKSARNG